MRLFRPTRIASVFVAATTLLGSPTAHAQASPLDGETIYARALQAWSAHPTPRDVAFDVVARLMRKGRVREERERVVLRSADRFAIVQRVTDDGGDDRASVSFETPRYDPDATFRLVPHDRAAPTDAVAASDDGRTIGRVVAHLRRYAVDLVGETTLDGHRVYDLRLRPLFDPQRNGVREMFVDAQTFETWRLLDEAPYALGPARGTFLLDARYAPTGSAWLLSRISTSGALRLGPFGYGGDLDLTYRILDVDATVPDYCFTRVGYDAHARCALSRLGERDVSAASIRTHEPSARR